ncbi:MAG: hypothetical protein F6K08_00200 [Okeania sp. SIO1H6]|nr:hypothetical protein [Okeania sp. SIO1H6]
MHREGVISRLPLVTASLLLPLIEQRSPTWCWLLGDRSGRSSNCFQY